MSLIEYNNGTVTATITGGTSPYQYELLQNGLQFTYGGVNYQPVVANVNSNTYTFGNPDPSGTYGLPSGTYTVRVTDAQGCIITTPNIVVNATEITTTAAPTTSTTSTTTAAPTTTSTTSTTTAAPATTTTTTAAPTTTTSTTTAAPATTTTTTAAPTTTTSTTSTTTAAPTTTTTTAAPTTTTSTTSTTTAAPTTTTTTAAPTTTTTTSTTSTTSTTTAAPTTTTSTTTSTTSTTTAAPLLGYYFHGGNQSYPFAQGDGLTASPTGTLYYDDGAGNAFEDTTDLSVAMTYIMDNMGTTYSPGNYTISSFNIPSSITALGTGDALNFDASTNAEFYYIILPDGQPDLTSVSPQHLVDGGLATNAIQKAQFTWNGVDYWIYKLGGGSQTAARTITFSDND